MKERRGGSRHIVSFPIQVIWKDENGKDIVEEGLTENVGPNGTLIYLPRKLPAVGGKVTLTVTENPSDPISVTAEVIRLERNAAHPQAALNLVNGTRAWQKVWKLAGEVVASMQPDVPEDW
ncbi:MAG: PilZ domain-containing protein [Blastocatellia bacterium]|nr:PilZ domain-containing protein [Blastocatellia bacterium]